MKTKKHYIHHYKYSIIYILYAYVYEIIRFPAIKMLLIDGKEKMCSAHLKNELFTPYSLSD